MHLSSGKLALSNVWFVVADDELVCKYVLVVLPVPQYLQFDTRTLLERNRTPLDGVDCSGVDNISTDKRAEDISRMMLCRINRATKRFPAEDHHQQDERRPFFHHDAARKEPDPFRTHLFWPRSIPYSTETYLLGPPRRRQPHARSI